MSPVRETYTFTSPKSTSSGITVPPVDNKSVNIKLSELKNNVSDLYKNKTVVGKAIKNFIEFTLENNTVIYNMNILLSFDDSSNSYVIFNISFRYVDYKPINLKLTAKSVGTGGKYSEKDVNVTYKSDINGEIKVILEYEK